jgi:hypothetical protein
MDAGWLRTQLERAGGSDCCRSGHDLDRTFVHPGEAVASVLDVGERERPGVTGLEHALGRLNSDGEGVPVGCRNSVTRFRGAGK